MENLQQKEIILIKPHHFFDIVKLYGAGIEHFVKDEEHGHDFYKVANAVLENREMLLELTAGSDDICAPCRSCDKTRCTDPLTVIPGYQLKENWNKVIDNRLFDFCGYRAGAIMTATELCRRLYEIKECIDEVWQEEPDEKRQIRVHNFCKGAERYLKSEQSFT